MTRLRDSQRSRVYAADDALDKFGGAERLETLPEIDAWLKKIASYRWFQRRWGRRTFRLSDGRGTRIARGGGGHLNLPRWARKKTVILHELAHNLQGGGAAHGWQFAHTLRLLARFVLGREAEQALIQAYKEERVRYKKPKFRKKIGPKRTMPAQAIAALARYREQKKAEREALAANPQ